MVWDGGAGRTGVEGSEEDVEGSGADKSELGFGPSWEKVGICGVIKGQAGPVRYGGRV